MEIGEMKHSLHVKTNFTIQNKLSSLPNLNVYYCIILYCDHRKANKLKLFFDTQVTNTPQSHLLLNVLHSLLLIDNGGLSW